MEDKPIKVLLVEDNPGDIRLIREMLAEARAPFDLECTDRLSAGLERLAEGGIDALLLDLGLSDSRGLDTFTRVYAQAPQVPIVILTALHDEALAVKAVREGAQDYLVKEQVDGDRLVRSIRYAIERKQTEKETRQSAEEWQATFDAVADFVSVQDKDFQILNVNKAYAEFFNMKPEELIGKTCCQVIHGTSEPWPNCPFKITLETKKSSVVEFLEPRLGIYLQVTTSPTVDKKGDVSGCVHFAKDITENRQAEEALRESEEKYKSLANNIRLGIFRSTPGPTGRFLEVNPAMEEVTGYSREELLQMDVSDLYVYPEEREAVLEGVALSLGTTTRELHFKRKDGTEIVVSDTKVAVRDSDGKILWFDGILEDITERKKMEEQLIRTDRLASIGELAAGIAHELNNPLTGVIGFAQLLMDKDISDDVKEDVKIIYSEAQRTAEVVKNLLTFARGHSQERQPVDINNIIQKVLELRAYEQRVSNIQVNTQFAPDLPEITADYSQLQQVFLNIVINAEHFMVKAHRRGTLTITTERIGNTIRAFFTDDGPGIAKEDLVYVFDPFFTTKEVGKGTGLGLSICHGVITEHGGRIYAESELGKGATFVVELPVKIAD